MIPTLETYAPQKSAVAPVAIRIRQALMVRAQYVAEYRHYRKGFEVWLFTVGQPQHKVLSIRKEWGRSISYRALVWDVLNKESRFVDLVPGQMLRVI